MAHRDVSRVWYEVMYIVIKPINLKIIFDKMYYFMGGKNDSNVDTKTKDKKSKNSTVFIVLAIVAAVFLIVLGIVLWIVLSRKKKSSSTGSSSTGSSSTGSSSTDSSSTDGSLSGSSSSGNSSTDGSSTDSSSSGSSSTDSSSSGSSSTDSSSIDGSSTDSSSSDGSSTDSSSTGSSSSGSSSGDGSIVYVTATLGGDLKSINVNISGIVDHNTIEITVCGGDQCSDYSKTTTVSEDEIDQYVDLNPNTYTITAKNTSDYNYTINGTPITITIPETSSSEDDTYEHKTSYPFTSKHISDEWNVEEEIVVTRNSNTSYTIRGKLSLADGNAIPANNIEQIIPSQYLKNNSNTYYTVYADAKYSIMLTSSGLFVYTLSTLNAGDTIEFDGTFTINSDDSITIHNP